MGEGCNTCRLQVRDGHHLSGLLLNGYAQIILITWSLTPSCESFLIASRFVGRKVGDL